MPTAPQLGTEARTPPAAPERTGGAPSGPAQNSVHLRVDTAHDAGPGPHGRPEGHAAAVAPAGHRPSVGGTRPTAEGTPRGKCWPRRRATRSRPQDSTGLLPQLRPQQWGARCPPTALAHARPPRGLPQARWDGPKATWSLAGASLWTGGDDPVVDLAPLPAWPGPLRFPARARDRPSGSPAAGPWGGRRKRPRGDSVLTSTITFREVSEPKLRSVPGTLLLMVAGRTQMGTQNSWWLLRASANMTELLKA